jgi:putative membrane protein
MTVSTNVLWLLVALFAGATIADVLAPSLFLTVVQLCLMVAFALLHGAQRYGAKGIAAFAVICLLVSNFMENIGVATGFPFGAYFYTDSLGRKLFYVPLLIGPAYLSVGYMAWALATILVGDVKRGADKFTAFATPFIGAFIMVLWDVALDPGAATIEKRWIWEHGGGFFGVPLTNYLGWFFTVYLFMQLFALYLRARGEATGAAESKGYLPGHRHVRDRRLPLRAELFGRRERAGDRHQWRHMAERRHLRDRRDHRDFHHGLRVCLGVDQGRRSLGNAETAPDGQNAATPSRAKTLEIKLAPQRK